MAKLLSVVSATGGCGKTFFSTNLAGILARSGQKVLLIDLDLQFGEVGVGLQLRPQHSIIDGLYGGDGTPLAPEELAEHFDDLLVHHESGFSVLTAPRDPAHADLVTDRDVERLLDVAMARFDLVVVDTPPALNEVVMTLLDRTDTIVVMASLDIPSLKNLSVYLETLARLGIDESHTRLVLNKLEEDVGIDSAQAQDVFDNRFVGLISHDRAVQRALNLGRLLAEEEPRGRATRQLADAVEAVMTNSPVESARASGVKVLTRIADLVRPVHAVAADRKVSGGVA